MATPTGNVTPQLVVTSNVAGTFGQACGHVPERPVAMAFAQGPLVSPRGVLPRGADFRSVSPRMTPTRTTVVPGPLNISRSGTPVHLRGTGNTTPPLFPPASPAMLPVHAVPPYSGPPSARCAPPASFAPVDHRAGSGPFARSVTPPPHLRPMPLQPGPPVARLAPCGSIVDYSLPQSAVQQGRARGTTPVRSSTPPPLAVHPRGPPSGSIIGYGPTAAACAPAVPVAYQWPVVGGNPGQMVPTNGVIEVQLAKSAGTDRFGFANIPAPDGRGLLISCIDGAGLLAQWNRAHPSRPVCEGDRIIGVNGAWEDQDAMRSHLERGQVVMHIEKLNVQPQ